MRIAWISADGEEREETWSSLERFRTWALAEGLHCSWRAYEKDDDEWLLVAEGRV